MSAQPKLELPAYWPSHEPGDGFTRVDWVYGPLWAHLHAVKEWLRGPAPTWARYPFLEDPHDAPECNVVHVPEEIYERMRRCEEAMPDILKALEVALNLAMTVDAGRIAALRPEGQAR